MNFEKTIALSTHLSGRLGILDDALREKIDEIERRIRSAISVRIAVKLDEQRALAFGKLNGTWCLLVVNDEHETPLTSADRETRALVFSEGHIARLIESAPLTIDVMIKQREEAVERAKEIIDAFGGST